MYKLYKSFLTLTAMECVTKLERIESCKKIANFLETKCVNFFEDQYRSAKTVGSFVSANIDNINLVNRLLVKSTNLSAAIGESSCKEVRSRTQCHRCKDYSVSLSRCQNIRVKCSATFLCQSCMRKIN